MLPLWIDYVSCIVPTNVGLLCFSHWNTSWNGVLENAANNFQSNRKSLRSKGGCR